MPAESLTAPMGVVSGDRAPARDPVAAHVITGLTVSALALLVLLRRDEFREVLLGEWLVLLPWALLIAMVNLLPLRIEDFSLTLDLPLLLAIAISVGPEEAATVAFLATLDTREVGVARIGLSRALFNRSQVALCVLLAGLTFHKVAHPSPSLLPAIWGTGLALLVDYSLNAGLVVLHLAARRKMPLLAAARKLTVGSIRQFLGTYLGFGVMALVLAYLYREIGFWPVLAFLVPILIARQALLRDMALQRAKDRLITQSHLLERALDRSVEEREDERARVAEELHDDILQCLFSLRMSIVSLSTSKSHFGEPRRELLSQIDEAILSLRRVIGGLRESPVGSGGFTQSLEGLAQGLRVEWRRNIVLEVTGTVALPNHYQVMLYQMIREAVLNALKHSNSQEIVVQVSNDSTGTHTLVQDYGVGFCVESERPQHFGLELIKRRAKRLGAHLEIQSWPGKGTRLSISIPAIRDGSRASLT